jgi:hypothetical protein
MKKLILAASSFILSLYITAQTTYKYGGSTTYKVLIDNPDDITPVIIGINPLVADTWNTNSNMGIGVFVSVNILKYGSVNIDWNKAYLDGIKGSLPIKNSSTGKKIRNHRGLEFGLAYNLLSFKKEKDLQVILSSELTFSGTRRTSTTTYIVAPGTAKKMIQLRGGLNNIKTGIDASDFGTGRFLINNDTAIKVKDFSAQMKMTNLYAGISWHTINNLVLQIGENGLSSNCNDYNFFFDMLYMPFNLKFPTVNYSDVLDRNTFPGADQLNSEMTLKDNSTVRKTGWRLGWEARKNNIKGAFTYKVEFGVRPGLKTSKKGILSPNSYMLLSAGFTFPAGKKYKAE